MSEDSSINPDNHPKFPDYSIAAFLNIHRSWDMTLNEYEEISEESRLTHPDFPGISLPTFELCDDEKFDLLLVTIYKQAVAYGKSIAKAESEKKSSGPKTKAKS